MTKWVVMMGTAPSGHGGIAVVAQQYLNHAREFSYPMLYLETHRAEHALSMLLTFLSSLSKLLTLLCRKRVRLVHVHSASKGSFARKSVLLFVARCFGVPTILHLHGGGFSTFYQSVRNPIMRAWIVHTFAKSSRVIVLSESWRERVKAFAPTSEVTILPNAIPIPLKAAKTSANDEINSKASSKSAQPEIFFAGRIDPLKGATDLVRAMPLLLEACPNAALVFAGDGAIEALKVEVSTLGLEAHVKLLGWIGQEELRKRLNACSIFALPSYAEGLPMVLLEAMVCGKPIVVSPVGGIPEVVKDFESALFVTPGSITEIAQALISLSTNSALAEKLGQNAQEIARQRYGLPLHIQTLNTLYRSVTAIKL